MGGSPESPPGGKPAAPKTLPAVDQVIATTCAECPAGCGLLVHLQGPKIVWLAGRPEHPVNRGRICLRAFGAVNRQTDPFRILRPCIREGNRGSGRWREVSWNEALLEILKRKGPATAFLDASNQRTGDFLESSFAACGMGDAYHAPPPYEPNALASKREMFGVFPFDPGLGQAPTVLNFGGDFLSPGDPRLFQAIRSFEDGKRPRIITLSPRMNRTASLSDEWIPVVPGSEGIVACAVAKVALSVADVRFIQEYVNASVDEVRKALEPYTPEKVKTASGVPWETVERLGKMFRYFGDSAIAVTGPETTASRGGVEAQRAIDLLNLFRNALYHHPREITADAPGAVTGKFPPSDGAAFLGGLLEGKAGLDLVVLHGADPVHDAPEPDRIASALKDTGKVKCLVVCGNLPTATAGIADIVLPAATALETYGLHRTHQALSLRRPVAEILPGPKQLRDSRARGKKHEEIRLLTLPRGKARAFADVCTALLPALAGKRTKFPTLEEHFTGSEFSNVAEKGFMDEALWPFGADRFTTSSGKIDFPREGVGLPSPDRPALADGELFLVPYEAAPIPRGPRAGKWLREMRSRNPLWVHPEAARERGLRNGQTVRVKSAVGEVEAVVKTTHWVHPTAVALAFGYGYEAGPPGAVGKSRESADPDTSRVWWSPHGPGPNVAKLVKFEMDPEGRGIAWTGTKVRLEGIG
jgi:anaerobic selenocysteine-containing dehydrogenase